MTLIYRSLKIVFTHMEKKSYHIVKCIQEKLSVNFVVIVIKEKNAKVNITNNNTINTIL